MLHFVALAELILCWCVWAVAFLKPRKQAAGQKEVVRASASRWGIFLVALGFALVWMQVHPIGFHKSAASLIASMVIAPPSVLIAWMATRHLGKQWRYQAAISEGHELIRTGPYAWIRHPIYASMFGMLLAAGFCLTWWPLFVAGIVAFVAGTEIRIHAEERLLAERFGETFAAYRASTPAYIPFLR